MKRIRHCAILGALVLSACSQKSSGPVAAQTQYLYLWTASDDAAQPDFLAVLDVTEDGPRYGRLVTTLSVPGNANGPHHTEHEMPADGRLFANGFRSGQSFVFDFTNPARISVINQNSPGRRLGVAIEPDDRNHAISVVAIQLIADGAKSIVGRGIALRENSGRRKQEERGKTFQHAGN